MLLVERGQHHGVRQDLVEQGAALLACLGRQADGQVAESPEPLGLRSVLAESRLG